MDELPPPPPPPPPPPGHVMSSLEDLADATSDQISFTETDIDRLEAAQNTPLPPDTPYINFISRMSRHMSHLSILRGPYRHPYLGSIRVLDLRPDPLMSVAPPLSGPSASSSIPVGRPFSPPLHDPRPPAPPSHGSNPPAPVARTAPSHIPQSPLPRTSTAVNGLPSGDLLPLSPIPHIHASSNLPPSPLPPSPPPLPPPFLPSIQTQTPTGTIRVPYSYHQYVPEQHDSLVDEMKSFAFESPQFGPELVRVFIVEDLCPGILEAVGQAFAFPHPEIFARHMVEAGHKDDDPEPPRNWNTADLKRPYATIKWYRPVYRRAGEYGIDVSKDILDAVNLNNAPEDIVVEDEFRLPLMMFGEPRVKEKHKKPRTRTNILRNSISLSVEKTPAESSKVPFLWEERATVYLQSRKRQINVFDEVTDDVIPYIAVRRQRHAPWELPGFKDAASVMQDLSYTHSTGHDIRDAFNLNSTRAQNDASSNDVFMALFTVILQDTRDAFDLMSKTLEEITRLSMDDFHMQEHLNHWRTLMLRMQKEAQALPEEFNQFTRDLYTVMPENIQLLQQGVRQDSQKIIEKIALCQAGLRADMSLLESRRGIAEAESVTRLTELAFIFIPLSFVASLFSMQIKELESGVPLTSFVVAALIVIVSIYSIRLVVRARPVKRAIRSIMSNARRINKLGANDDIPLTLFLKFMIRWIFFGEQGEVWVFWLFLSAIGISIIPVALLWSQSAMDVGFKAVGTVILFPAGVVMAWLLVSSLMNEAKPSWSPEALNERAVDFIRNWHRRKKKTNAQV
ncbi:hypothetical protein EJ04DRAFT_556461 [Polyplosphaeria fusca]|uniref:Mg2+ transporter protein, CorA-like/Zinc transport protein ZntB n=1 Tax=Polyplosphaeria fusca TaxID=682080 RepID=A0A9P4QM47_9PLEO|nr:hypothetical protein EJ04DRAFT_556461 [Polyplosphaeria fusca]